MPLRALATVVVIAALGCDALSGLDEYRVNGDATTTPPTTSNADGSGGAGGGGGNTGGGGDGGSGGLGGSGGQGASVPLCAITEPFDDLDDWTGYGHNNITAVADAGVLDVSMQPGFMDDQGGGIIRDSAFSLEECGVVLAVTERPVAGPAAVFALFFGTVEEGRVAYVGFNETGALYGIGEGQTDLFQHGQPQSVPQQFFSRMRMRGDDLVWEATAGNDIWVEQASAPLPVGFDPAEVRMAIGGTVSLGEPDGTLRVDSINVAMP